MKKGYIVSVKDKAAGDTAYKVVLGDKESAESRRLKIESNYKKIEGDFDVLLDSQYSEFSEEDFTRLQIFQKNGYKIGDFHKLCSEIDYVVTSWEEAIWTLEVHNQDLDALKRVLDKAGIKHATA